MIRELTERFMGLKQFDDRLLNSHKLTLLKTAFHRLNVKTFADLGGVWRVEGGYSFYAAWLGMSGYLVDTHPTDTVRAYAAKDPKVEIVEGSFGDPAIAEQVKGVDAVFLFDVLLHQVRPNWDEILKLYSWARVVIIYNQQWTGPETVRLMELGEAEFFRNVPHRADEHPYDGLFERLDTPHPLYSDRNWRDVHHIWQWGITDRDLLGKMFDLGYKLDTFGNAGPFGALPQFEDHYMVFVRP